MKSVKKLLITFLLIFFITSCNGVYAQFEVGIYAGMNNVKFSGDKPPEGKYVTRNGLMAGVNIGWDIAKDVTLTLQPGYLTASTRLQFVDTVENVYKDSVEIKLNMLMVPLLFKVDFQSSKRIYVVGGFDFLINMKAIGDNGAEKIDLSGDLTSMNIAMSFGIGYRFKLKSSSLAAEIRYAQGLMNISDFPDDKSKYLPRVKTSSTRFLIAWTLPVFNSSNHL